MSNISPLACVNENAKIGNNVKIGPFVTIDENVEIGDNCIIDSNATIHSGARIGNNCHIHSGAVISDIPKSRLYQLKSYDSFARDVYLRQVGQAYDILVFYNSDEIIYGKSAIGEQIKENGKIIYQRKTA